MKNDNKFTLYPTNNLDDPEFKEWWEALRNNRLDRVQVRAPEALAIEEPIFHFRDLDTNELYVAYQKISQIIDRFAEESKRSTRTQNPWSIDDLRTYCQTWLDDVRFRQDGNSNRWWVFDRIKYFFKGQLRERKQWLQTFGTICYDMCTRLDDIDGGAGRPEGMPLQNKHLGF